MPNTTRNTVVGVFADDQTVQAVIDDLVSSGVSRNDIHTGSKADWYSDAATGGAGLTGHQPESKHAGVLGWFENLFGSDTPEEERGRYAETVQRGHHVIAVDTDAANSDRVMDVLERHDAIDIDQQFESSRQAGYTGHDANAAAYSDEDVARERQVRTTNTGRQDTVEGGAERAIPVVREELQVGKRAVQRGGVRVYTRTVETPVEEQVTLREERVRVDRRPANRPVTDADLNTLRDQTIEVTEMAEEAVVNKQARVVEEVVVGKESRDRTETIRDTVRSQEVEVEDLTGQRGGVGQTGSNYRDEFRRDFQSRYANQGGSYDTYAPAYDYGYTMAGDPRYQGRNFEDVEDTLKTDYLRNNPNSSWDRMRGAVRYGWEQMTGKR
jgi:uncharacterized protein (TIGR02271 family)